MAKTTNEIYKEKNYDRLAIWVKKGTRDEYKAAASEQGISLAALVQLGVEEYISNHTGGEFLPPTTTAETLTTEEKRLLAAFAKCPDNMRPTLKKLVEQVAALVDKGGD